MTRAGALCTALFALVVGPCSVRADERGVASSGYVALFAFEHHSYRHGGGEAQLRADAWRDARAVAHVQYTLLAISEDADAAGTRRTSFFHDVAIGGRYSPFAAPAWLFAELHGLAGPTRFGKGGAGFVGVGAQRGAFSLELGAGGVWVEDDHGATVAARLAWSGWQDRLELAAEALYTDDDPASAALGDGERHLAYAAGARIAPSARLSVGLRWLGGERTLALDRLGSVVENLPDVERDLVSASVAFAFGRATFVYVGASGRRALEPGGASYRLGSGCVGGVVTF